MTKDDLEELKILVRTHSVEDLRKIQEGIAYRQASGELGRTPFQRVELNKDAGSYSAPSHLNLAVTYDGISDDELAELFNKVIGVLIRHHRSEWAQISIKNLEWELDSIETVTALDASEGL